ncbi:hypothetical protein Tco_0522744 [Tanacetum coccineum]
MVVFVSENIEALENVAEDKPHFLTEGLLGPNGRRCGGIGGRGGSMTGRGGGWFAKHSIVSNEGHSGGRLVVRRANVEDCLEGFEGVGGREVKGGGVVLGVLKSRLGEIPSEVIRESGGDIIGLDGGAVW